MRKIFLLVVPFYPVSIPTTSSLTANLPFFGRKKDDEANKISTEQQFKENASQLQQRVDAVVEGIRQIGLEASILETQELMELYYNFYNPDSVERDNVPMTTPTEAAASVPDTKSTTGETTSPLEEKKPEETPETETKADIDLSGSAPSQL